MIHYVHPEKLLPKSLVVTSRTNHHYAIIKSKDFNNYPKLKGSPHSMESRRFYIIKISIQDENLDGVNAIRLPRWTPEAYTDIQSIRERLDYLAVNMDIIDNLLDTIIYNYPEPVKTIGDLKNKLERNLYNLHKIK